MKTQASCRWRHYLAAATLMISAGSAVAESIKLGLNYPSTGRYKEQGIAQANGALLAVDEINERGGVLGRQLELLYANSASKPDKAVKNVRNLASQGAAMLFGGSSSAVAIAGGKEAAKQGLIYFGTLTAANETTGVEGHKHMFREYYSTWMACKMLSKYMNQHMAGKKVFYITADYSWGSSTESSLRQLTDTMDVNSHPHAIVKFPKPRQSDLEKALKQAEESGAEVLVVIQFGRDLATALQLAHKRGLKDKMEIIAPTVTLGMARSTGAGTLEGVISTVPWIWSLPYQYDYADGIRFVESYLERYGEYPSSSAASAYSIVYQFSAAAERAKSLRTNKLIKALENHSYVGLKDEQTWRAFDHQNVQTVYLLKGRAREDVMKDKLKSDYFEIIDSIPGSEAARTYEEWVKVRTAAGKPGQLQ
ncbi:MAG: branched-chain amino acid ABC transporter substrate-binding protein [Oceanospirillaceae bacterium]|nr:branched-chain amino acid ABC transporter substrate-binding protein [Oceanospirillaceae bacterium]